MKLHWQRLQDWLVDGTVRFCLRARSLIVILALLATVVGTVTTKRGLALDMDRTGLLETRAEYLQNYRAFRADFATDDELVFAVCGKDRDRNRAAALELGKRLRAFPQAFETVFDRLDLGFVSRHALLYMSVDDLEKLASRLEELREPLAGILARPGLAPIFLQADEVVKVWFARFWEGMAHETDTHVPRRGRGLASRQGGPLSAPSTLQEMVGVLRFLTVLLGDMARWLDGQEATVPTLWDVQAAPADAPDAAVKTTNPPRDVYLEADQGRIFLVLAHPRGVLGNVEAMDACIARARQIRAEVQKACPDVEIGLTGRPVIEHDETKRSSIDSERATLISLVGVMLLFGLAFRNVAQPLLAMACLLMSLSWTLGLITVLVGHLNPLTASALPMLVGLGIDFGIQVICRFQEERGRGASADEAVEITLRTTGASILTAALITAVAFSVTFLSAFRGIREFAWLAGSGILFSGIAMLIVLPALMGLVEGTWLGSKAGATTLRTRLWGLLARMERGALAHTLGLLLFWGTLSILLLTQVRWVRYDANVLHLQDPDMASVQCVRKLIQESGHSVLSAAVLVDDIEQARRMQARIAALPSVAEVLSVVPLVPDQQDEKAQIIQRIRLTLQQLPAPARSLPPVELVPLRKAVSDLRAAALSACHELERVCGPSVRPRVASFVSAADSLLAEVDEKGPRQAAADLQRYQEHLFGWIREKIAFLQRPFPTVTVASLPAHLKTGLVGQSGRLLLRVLPRGDAWEAASLERFIEQVRVVAPQATGSAVEIYESTRLLERDYMVMVLVSALGVVLLVGLHFGSWRDMMLVLAPQCLGMGLMLGLMGLYDLPFNPGNLLCLSLIQGVAVANGIYIVRRFREQETASMLACSTGRAILMSNLSALIGFSSLLVSRHAGLWSFGILMTVGVGCCMVVSLLVLPLILQVLLDRGRTPASSPSR